MIYSNDDSRDDFIDQDGYRIKVRKKQNMDRIDDRPDDADWSKRRSKKKKPKRGNKREY